MSNKEILNFNAESPVVLQMLLEEIKHTRTEQQSFAAETRDEFRRIHDKIDALRDEVRDDFQEHDRDIVRLTTEAAVAAKRSGFISGALASLAVYAAVAFLSWGLDKVGLVFGG